MALQKILSDGPTPVPDQSDLSMRGLVATLVRDGVVRAFRGYVHRQFMVYTDQRGNILLHEFPKERHESYGLTLEPFAGDYFPEHQHNAFVLSSFVQKAPADGYYLDFRLEAEKPDTDGNQLVHRGCSLDKLTSEWDPRKLIIIDGKSRPIVPRNFIDARLEINYAERSTQKDGRFHVLGVERSITVYGKMDPIFQQLMDRVVVRDQEAARTPQQ